MFDELSTFLPWAIVAPDLPGHGLAHGMPTEFRSVTSAVADLAGGRPLLGYSQGGRIALAVALDYPNAVSHLMLVSSGVGISNGEERRRRLEADGNLAGRIEREGLASFIDDWLSRSMFDGLRRRDADWTERDRRLRLENTPAGIAGALRGMGQGAQPFLGGRLAELAMPVLFLAGESDPDYVGTGERIVGSVGHGTLVVVRGAGHALVGEVPDRVAEEIESFLIGSEGLERRE
jgi:2-succinyl-6-hydroxy-2,4-cyclohexadiene-1-carboxylate synthase